MTEKRHQCVRRDLNDAVRDESGKFSFEKIGTYAGQYIAAQYLVVHWEQAIESWDILTVLFSVLIAPSLFKKLMNMKYSGSSEPASPPSGVKTTTLTEVVPAKG